MGPLLSRVFRLFAASVVPGGGYFIANWSPATALTLYWIDNVIGSVAMALRIAEHRRLTRAAGHAHAQLGATMTMTVNDEVKDVQFGSFLSEFLITTTGFGVAHGLFLAFVLANVLSTSPGQDALKQGTIAIALCHAIALTFDRFTLGDWPFKRLKTQAQRLMGRVALVNMAILGGTWYMAFNSAPGSFFKVFIWLKAAADVGNMLPSMESKNAPRALVWLMNFFPKQNGETFEEYWNRTHRAEDEDAARDEQVEAPPRRTKRRR